MRLIKGLETSSSITVPFTAENPINLPQYMDHGERLKSQIKRVVLKPEIATDFLCVDIVMMLKL
jgi:hypothetical protein